jgi:multimeric flavodoxin WrbA
MRVCGIIGSPKKNGNVDLLVSQVLKGAQIREAETSKIYLNDLSIKPCQSCGVDPNPNFCLFDDDMKVIYDALETCDAIVLGTPVYFDTVSAQTKLMIDRCNCLVPYVKVAEETFGFERRMKKHKKGVFVCVGGTDEGFGTILETVKGFFNWANIELVKTILFPHEDNELGGVKRNKTKMAEAFDSGMYLAE